MSPISASPDSILHPDGFPVHIHKSRRKTLALKVQQGKVTVHMPQSMPMRIAHQFVRDKTAWLRRQLNRHAALPQRGLNVGDQQLFLGQWYPSAHGSNTARRSAVLFTDEQFILETRQRQPADSEMFRKQLSAFYRQQAHEYLPQRINDLAAELNLIPNSIRIRYYKSRWGSCHGNGEIRLNWQLIQAPRDIIDYVIVHELCHLRHMNHSSAFWALVEKHCADYRTHRQWLRDNGTLLQF